VAEESTRRSVCLSDLSHTLSGLLDVRTGLHRLLAMVVPRLAAGATVALVDEQLQLRQVARLGRAGEAVVDLVPSELSPIDQERLRRAMRPLPVVAVEAQLLAYPLRDGERVLGALLLHGDPTALGAGVLDEIASRAAIAFSAAQLHQSLQEEIIERRRAEARLEEANKRKDEFLAMLSHELRNPLAPIGNAVEVIRRLGGHDPKLIWATDVTDRQVRQLTRLVDELLDVARISQGKIVLQTVPTDIAALLVQCVELQRPLLARRRQTLTQALPPVPVWAQADPARLQQVINNLLSNANKYTPDGGRIHVAVTVERDHAVLSVADDGIGIEAELLPRIFDLFEQGQRSLDRSQGGLGVGLTLVQRLVRLHDGRVEARSAGPGQGAEFSVHLPCLPALAVPPSADRAQAQGMAKVPRRVLLVEDNADVAETTAAMLQMAGHTLRWARDGEQALTMAEEFAPEIVLLDIGLPRLDGYQVARRLRQLPQTRRAWLVALTGYGMPGDRLRGQDAGFDQHLLKPVDPSTLMSLIEDWTPAREEEAPAEEPPPARATLYTFRRP